MHSRLISLRIQARIQRRTVHSGRCPCFRGNSVNHGELEAHVATLIRDELPKEKWVVAVGGVGYNDAESVKGLIIAHDLLNIFLNFTISLMNLL